MREWIGRGVVRALLTLTETAGYVNLSVSKIQALCRQQRFPEPKRIDKNVRWRIADLDAWVSEDLPVETKKTGRPRMAY
jgi:predicted DNA-binding transcriptional regulator AlpA